MSADDILRRTPPHHLDAEKSMVGSVFIAEDPRDVLNRIFATGFVVDDFYRETHRQIMRAFVRLDEAGDAIDAVTICTALREEGVLEQIGGPAYIAELAGFTPTALHAAYYARIVKSAALQRELISVGTELQQDAFETGSGPELDELLAKGARRLDRIAERRKEHQRESTATVIARVYDQLGRLDTARPLSTGFRKLDHVLGGGFRIGQLVTLAARTGEGKSTLGLNIAANIASVEKPVQPVLFISLEMPLDDELAERLIIAEAQVRPPQRDRDLFSPEWLRLREARDRIMKWPLDIQYLPAITPRGIRRAAERFAREHARIALLVVDYVQLVEPDQPEHNREREVAAVTRTLKNLAGEMRCPVLQISQLNRESLRRDTPEPRKSDLRDSGAIENDSDTILFLWHENETNDEEQTAKLKIDKQRRGPQGITIDLKHRPRITRFDADDPEARQ